MPMTSPITMDSSSTPLTIQVHNMDSLDSPTTIQESPKIKTVFVRMKDFSGSIVVELTPAIRTPYDIIRRFHELAFAKSYAAFIRAASLLRMHANVKTGLPQETKVTTADELDDHEVLVYKPCEELRILVEQGCITPVLSSGRASLTRSPTPSPTSSPSLKRKGRVASVTNNIERVHRYGTILAKMDVSPREKELIEDMLIVGDEQVVDAMEQFVLHRNPATVRRVLHGPSKSDKQGTPSNISTTSSTSGAASTSTITPTINAGSTNGGAGTLDNLSLDFSTLDVHSPAIPASANPFLTSTVNPFITAANNTNPTTSFHDVTNDFPSMMMLPVDGGSSGSISSNSSRASRPSLMFDDPSTSVFLPSIKEKTTPPSRTTLSLDATGMTFNEASPQFFSVATLLVNVPVGNNFTQCYSVGKILGSGKYSVVKECRHVKSGIKYAVKIIDKRQMMEIRFLKRELEIMYGLNHDGVVQLVELFETNEELFLVMELCRQELFEYIDRNGPLGEATAQRLIKKLVGTVAYLHAQCIVHRDIKPENILIHDMNDVSDIKLTDFGIARKLEGHGECSLTPHESLSEVANLHDQAAASSSSALSMSAVRNRLARAHTKCGTRDYVAPEVMSGKGYGMEADLWSVGVVTHVLLSGCAPVFLPTADGTKKLFFQDDTWSGMSDEAKRFIEALLVRNPEERISAPDALEHPWLKM